MSCKSLAVCPVIGALLLAGCESGTTSSGQPQDVDLGVLRTGFQCGSSNADAAACAAIDGFAAAGPMASWPAGGELHRWIGAEHCVAPSMPAGGAAFQVVYLRTEPAATAPGRVPFRGGFGASQIGPTAPQSHRQALAALARGERPPVSPATLATLLPPDAPSVYRPLVRAASGVSVSDDPPIWYLRSAGARLFLASSSMQDGCVSELRRIQD